jgi:hypothetical protein
MLMSPSNMAHLKGATHTNLLLPPKKRETHMRDTTLYRVCHWCCPGVLDQANTPLLEGLLGIMACGQLSWVGVGQAECV